MGQYPFYSGVDAVPYEMFAGREDLRKEFTALSWERSGERRSSAWVLEGRSSYGKSSFAKWCREIIASRGQNAGVVVCSISMSQEFSIKTETSYSVVTGERFFSHLYDKLFKSFRSCTEVKSIQWKERQTRRLGGKALGWLLGGEYFNIKFPHVRDFGPKDPTKFFKAVKRLSRYSKSSLKAIVFIIDDITLREGGPAVCSELVMSLHTCLLDWSNDFPNILIILLPLPGWDKTVLPGQDKTLSEIGLHRRIEKHYILEPFSLREVFDYVQSRCGETGWKFDRDSFVPTLFYLSGGIPYLFQQIGVGACRICEQRDSKNLILTGEDVGQAIMQDKSVAKAIKDTVEGSLQFKWEKYVMNDFHRKILPCFYRIAETDKANWAGQFPDVVNGLAKPDWNSRVLGPIGTTEPYQNAFNELWDALHSHGILIIRKDSPGKYAFCAEAIRLYFNRVY